MQIIQMEKKHKEKLIIWQGTYLAVLLSVTNWPLEKKVSNNVLAEPKLLLQKAK